MNILNDYNSRDYRRLLKSLDPQLQHLDCEHEKANKKFSSESFSVIFNKICLQENQFPKYTMYIYIYIYIHCVFRKLIYTPLPP